MVAQEKQIHWQKNVDADKQLDTDVSGIRHSFSKKKKKIATFMSYMYVVGKKYILTK